MNEELDLVRLRTSSLSISADNQIFSQTNENMESFEDNRYSTLSLYLQLPEDSTNTRTSSTCTPASYLSSDTEKFNSNEISVLESQTVKFQVTTVYSNHLDFQFLENLQIDSLVAPLLSYTHTQLDIHADTSANHDFVSPTTSLDSFKYHSLPTSEYLNIQEEDERFYYESLNTAEENFTYPVVSTEDQLEDTSMFEEVRVHFESSYVVHS